MAQPATKDIIIPVATVVLVGIAAALLLPPLVAALRPIVKSATERALTTVLIDSARKLVA